MPQQRYVYKTDLFTMLFKPLSSGLKDVSFANMRAQAHIAVSACASESRHNGECVCVGAWKRPPLRTKCAVAFQCTRTRC